MATDFSWLLGIPPTVILWALVKCGIEVNESDADDPAEANKLYWYCIIDSLIPLGLPDPDRFADEDEEA